MPSVYFDIDSSKPGCKILRNISLLKTLIRNPICKLLFLLILIYAVLGAASLYQSKPKIDEYYNHLPVVEAIYSEGMFNYILGGNYLAANTPLPYLFPLGIARTINHKPSLYITRITNFLISVIVVVLVYLLLFKLSGQFISYSLLIIIFYPYFLKTSFTFYMGIYGILFMLLSIYFIDSSKLRYVVLSGLFCAAAILSQQFLIILPLALITYRFVFNYDKKFDIKFLKETFLFSLPLILPVLLFIQWGGFTHPNFRFHGISFQLSNVTAILVILGLTLSPFILFNFKKFNFTEILYAFIFSIFISAIASPVFAEKGGVGKITGITFHLIELTKNFSPVFPFILKVVFSSFGILIFISLFKSLKSDYEIFFIIISLLLFIGFSFTELLAERHLLPLIILLYLLVLSKINDKRLLLGWLSIQAVFGSIYYYYYLFLTPNY